MKTFYTKKMCATALMLSMTFLSGCEMNDDVATGPKVSNDIAALQSLVSMDLPMQTARWEVFGTPEYTGGVPGPTDFVTLIAEIEPLLKSNTLASHRRENIGLRRKQLALGLQALFVTF